MGRYLFNSLLIATALTLLSLAFNLSAGYAFAKLQFRGRERIFQVFSNLIGNAIKATRSGGRIEMTAERRGDRCEFSITDNGPGIAADHLAHIFERYWQGQRSDQRGAGLGLYIAEGIVRAHGGTIRAESEMGRGTRFVFGLPLA